MRGAIGAVCSAQTDHEGSTAGGAGSAFESLSIPSKKSDKRNGQKKQKTGGGRNGLE